VDDNIWTVEGGFKNMFQRLGRKDALQRGDRLRRVTGGKCRDLPDGNRPAPQSLSLAGKTGAASYCPLSTARKAARSISAMEPEAIKVIAITANKLLSVDLTVTPNEESAIGRPKKTKTQCRPRRSSPA
jgi:hypothetical protein